MNFSHFGFVAVVAVVFTLLLGTVVVDIGLTFKDRKPVGHYVNEFVATYPWFAALLALVFGGMLAHFFLNINHG